MYIFPAMKGVCDTPLHIFDYFTGITMVVERAFSPPWRAYAIRPYTCSIISWVQQWWNDVQHPRHGGRMRYAPTPVRSFHGYNVGGMMCIFPAMEGVCDTPLHLFGENVDETVVG